MPATAPTLSAPTRPAMIFIGVTTTQSSMMRIFPEWTRILGLDADLIGFDAPLNAPPETYRAVVNHIKTEPLVRGALVTTHKLDLLAAARSLFDELDPFAQLCGEVSCLAVQDGRLVGYAKDPISSKVTWESFVPPGHWERTNGEVLCLGAGGAAVAISVAVANLPNPADRPRRFILVDRARERLGHISRVHARLQTDIAFEYALNAEAYRNDALLASLPPGSLVINATGLGKDRPGSPLTNAARFPADGLVWELNYRGSLDFLQQARRQAESRRLHLEDGWTYFLHGWIGVITEIFGLPDPSPEQFAALNRAATRLR